MIEVGDKILLTSMIPFGRYIFTIDKITDKYIYYISANGIGGCCTVEYFKTFGIVLTPLMWELL